MNLRRIATAVAVTAALGVGSADAVPTTALYLTMDGSDSISDGDFTTQINSYVSALNSVFGTYGSHLYGDIAIGGGIFGGDFVEFFAVETIDDATDLAALTGAVAALDPGRGGVDTAATAIGDAVSASSSSLVAFETLSGIDMTLLIDVTTDGSNNAGSDPSTVANGLVPAPLDSVNCLGIDTGADCTWVAGAGTNFGTVSFAGLAAALEAKILRETGIPTVPVPTTMALLGLGLAGIGFSRRRKAG